MKIHDIELQRIKSMSQGNGLVEARIDAVVASLRPGDDETPMSTLRMTEATARTLLLLLREQLAAIDKRKARSQR
jgi:hypothetical protein